MAYVIGSQKGKDIAESLKTGQKYEASDGSVWTKQADGSVSVKTSKGETFNNAYTPTASGGTSGGSGGGSSGGNSQYTGSSTAINVNNRDQQDIKDQMNANSIAWWSAPSGSASTIGTKEWYEAQNQSLAEKLGGTVSYNAAAGTWSGTARDDSFEYTEEKPEYNNKYDPQIDAILNEILNRKDFSYDVANDPLYQQYAAMYQREGDRAMKEAMAEAAAGAGGMNTYAMTAAQQANSYYNSQLNDKIPQLYQLAYEMYLQDKESKVQDLGLLQNMDATQYGRYRDTLNDYYNDKNFAYGVYRDDVADSQWEQTFNNNNYWANKEFDYNVGRDTIADNRYDKEWEYNTSQYDKETAKEEVWKLIELGVADIDPELIKRAEMDETTVALAVAAVKAEKAKKGKDEKVDDLIYNDHGIENWDKLVEFEKGSENYQDIDKTCSGLFKKGGWTEVQTALNEAREKKLIDQSSYMRLFNKYRDMQ